MTMTTHRRPVRGGFTLIELLVVFAIIVVLISLISAAVFKVFARTSDVRAGMELREISAAMSSAESGLKINGQMHCPSRIWLDETMRYDPVNSPPTNSPWAAGDANLVKLAADSKSFLHTAFPQMRFGSGVTAIDWNGDGTAGNTNLVLEGDQCLVFWLSGIPSNGTAAQGFQGLGFSNSPSNPAAAGGTRLGPWYEFKSSRLIRRTNSNYLSYVDAYPTKNNQVYAYFSSFNGQNGYNRYTISATNANPLSDCASLGVFPYQQSVGGPFLKPDSFQIICAGKDGVFGAGGIWTSGTANTVYPPGSTGANDLANFYDYQLGVPQ